MKCPRCQQENPSHVKFCLECGGSFISKGPSAGSYHELQRALAEALEQQTATEEILRVISRSPTHLQPVLDTIARSAVRVCGASDALVAIREGDESVTAAHYGDQEVVALGQRRPIIRGLVLGRALLEARPVQVEDITQTDEFPEGRAIAVRFGHRTVMAVPLLRDGVAIGGIIMRRSEVERFSDKQIALLQTFADQAVIAIENVRLFNETKAALEQQTATSEILRVISQSPTDVQPVFDAIVRSASHLCGGEYAIVTRYDGEFLRLAAQYNARPGLANVTERFFPRRPGRDLPSGRAILDRAAAHIPDTAEDRDLGPDVAGIAGSYLSVPMVRDDVPVGAIGVSRATVGRFAPEQIALLQTFADQAVIAIENVRLFKELQEKNHALTVAHAQVTEALERQTATADVLGIIAKSPTALQPVLDAIATSAARLCRAYDATLLRLDGDTLHLVAHHGPIPSAAVLPVRGTVGGRCAVEREAVHVLDLQAEVEAFPEASVFARQFGFRTILTVPLLREDQTIGVLQLRRTEVAVFTEQQVTLLRTFADQAVIAIENVRLFTELQEKNRALTEAHAQVTEAFERQTATSEILGIISRSPTDVQPVFDTIVRSATKLCDGLFGALVRFDGELVHFVAQHNFPPAALDEVRRIWPTRPSRISGAGRAILDRAVVQIPDIELDSEYGLQQLSRTVGHRSSIYVPMLRDSLPIGVIVVARREVGRFADNQVELLKTFADQAVIAIENVRLFTELQSRNRELTEALEQQTATSEILRVIAASSTDVQPVFDTIVRSARRLCNASDASLVRFDGELMHLAATTAVEPGRNAALRSQFPARPTRTLALCRAIVDRVVVHIPDVAEDPEYPQDHARRVGLASILVVPMLREGTAIGSVGVSRTVPEAFSDTQVALLKTFADQAGSQSKMRAC
jgi:GAF domain-containing protein